MSEQDGSESRGGGAADRRVFCLLQGPSSLFFDALGDALAARGASVLRVCFCLGDRLYWRGKPYVWHRGALADWPAAARRLLRERAVTDVVMLGDSRPRHRAAIEAARDLGRRAHIVEHGYFRPDWLTHELFGMAARSHFRAAWDRGEIAREGAASPAELAQGDRAVFKKSFLAYAAMDVAYNMGNVLSRPFVAPRYGGHSNLWPLVEYSGWIRKLAIAGARDRAARAAFEQARASGRPLYLWALQLETDFQIREDGVGRPQTALIAPVLASFARAAPPEARLLVKDHPLDNTLIDWRGRLRREAERLGIADRVVFLGGGDLEAMLAAARGAFSVNSSVGLRSIALGVKTMALGPALYAMPGLTVQGGLEGLDGFWRSEERPDPALAAAFLTALKRDTQLRGGFDGEGVAPGAAALAERMLSC